MNGNKFTAIVFGASGLTGRFVTEHLIHDNRYEEIKLFVRKEINFPSGKVRQFLFDRDNLDSVAVEITGDHLFCCIGSTIKQAGSKEEFYRIDHDFVERIAKIASSNKVKSFVVISSIGANHLSSNFYLNTKGQMEESIKTFNFNNLSIVRPSMLLGIRKERRTMEEVAKIFMKVFGRFMLGKLAKYRPIHSSTVAKSMILLANKPSGVYTVESDELDRLVKTQ